MVHENSIRKPKTGSTIGFNKRVWIQNGKLYDLLIFKTGGIEHSILGSSTKKDFVNHILISPSDGDLKKSVLT